MPKPVKSLPDMTTEEFHTWRAQVDLIEIGGPNMERLLADALAEVSKVYDGNFYNILCGYILEKMAYSRNTQVVERIYEVGSDKPVEILVRR